MLLFSLSTLKLKNVQAMQQKLFTMLQLKLVHRKTLFNGLKYQALTWLPPWFKTVDLQQSLQLVAQEW